MARKPRPVTDAERERVRELHAAGKGRNDIAAELDRGAGTISRIARDLGLSFARADEVRAATEVRQADLADRRAAFAIRLHDIAEREAAKIDKPHTYFDWGGKDHDFDTYEAPEPTPTDKRALMGVVATAVDRSMKLAPPKEEDANLQAAQSVLGSLAEGIRQIVNSPSDGDGSVD